MRHTAILAFLLIPIFAMASETASQQTVFGLQDVAGKFVGRPVDNPTKSFWLHSSQDANPLANHGSTGPLTTDADVCIIGSGMTGTGTAWHLSKILEKEDGGAAAPLKVVILEAREFASGATGRNGGHLTPNLFGGFIARAFAYGAEEAIKSFLVERRTVSKVVEFLRNKSLEERVDLVNGNHIAIFRSVEEEKAAMDDWEAAKLAGLPDIGDEDVKWLTNEDLVKNYGLNPSLSYTGLLTPGYNLRPPRLATAFYEDISQTVQATLHTHTPATSIVPTASSGRKWSIQTPRGSINCTYVVHATNAYTGHLLPFLGTVDGGLSNAVLDPFDPASIVKVNAEDSSIAPKQGILPVRGQVGAVRASVDAKTLGWLTSWDGGSGWEYWFPRYQGLGGNVTNPLIILGGGRQHSGGSNEMGVTDDATVNERVSQHLQRFIPAFFPGKFDDDSKSWEMIWTGVMAFTKSGDPFVGPVGPLARQFDSQANPDDFGGQFVSAGYTGHGMPRASACGEVIAEMIIAKLRKREWITPSWLPERYLTWSQRPL